MNVTWLVLLIVAGVLLLVGLIVGLVFFVLSLIESLGGTTGGWRRLVEVYGTTNSATGRVTKWESIQVGALAYNRCVTLGVADEGLYVTIWRKTALIPWSEFTAVEQGMLHWRRVPRLTIGHPPVATMTVPVQVFQVMRNRLPEGLA